MIMPQEQLIHRKQCVSCDHLGKYGDVPQQYIVYNFYWEHEPPSLFIKYRWADLNRNALPSDSWNLNMFNRDFYSFNDNTLQLKQIAQS